MPPSSPPARSLPILEYALLILLAAIWGMSFSFLKIAVESIPPVTTIALRTGIAGALLLAIMHRQGLRLPLDAESWKSFAMVSAVNTVAPFLLLAWALQWVDAGLGVILNTSVPIFAFLITWGITRHEPATAAKLAGVLIGIAGVLLIIGFDALYGLGGQLVPQLAVVLASLSYAIAAVYGRTFREMSPLAPAAGSMLVGAAVLAPLALVVERPWAIQPTWTSIISLIVLAVVCTAGGNALYFRLLGTLGPLSTTAQSYLRVPIGVLAGMLLLGEKPAPTALIGLVLIFIGVAAMTVPPRALLNPERLESLRRLLPGGGPRGG